MENEIYFIQKKTGRKVSYIESVQLDRDDLAAISGDADKVYYGTITIPGTADIVQLNYNNKDTVDETTFDNTDAVGSGAMAGTFREVLFNDVVRIDAALGEVYFTGVKATLES